VHGVHVEPLALSGNQDVFVVIVLLVGDVGVYGEVLLREFWINLRVLLGRE
jgi:hypothetical protein